MEAQADIPEAEAAELAQVTKEEAPATARSSRPVSPSASVVSGSSRAPSIQPQAPKDGRRPSTRPGRRNTNRAATEKEETEMNALLTSLAAEAEELEKVAISKTADLEQLSVSFEKIEAHHRVLNKQLKDALVERAHAYEQLEREHKQLSGECAEREKVLKYTKSKIAKAEYLLETAKLAPAEAVKRQRQHDTTMASLTEKERILDKKAAENALLEQQINERLEALRLSKIGDDTISHQLEQEFDKLSRREQDLLVLRNAVQDKERIVLENTAEHVQQIVHQETSMKNRRKQVEVEVKQRRALLEQLEASLGDRRAELLGAKKSSSAVKDKLNSVKSEKARLSKKTSGSPSPRRHGDSTAMSMGSGKESGTATRADSEKENKSRQQTPYNEPQSRIGLQELQKRSTSKFEQDYQDLQESIQEMEERQRNLALRAGNLRPAEAMTDGWQP